jgi:hypothetical protein
MASGTFAANRIPFGIVEFKPYDIEGVGAR